MTKPSLFIASSVEGLSIADAINANLEHDVHCTVWRNGTFKLSSQTVDDLVKKSSATDFAVFAFTPDDLATIRKHEESIARDNVVFELGLFIGSIGKDRCYVVKPRAVEMHLPSDLLGMTFADYASDRPDGDIASAVNYACKQIKDRVRDLGPIDRSPFVRNSGTARHIANPPDYQLRDADLLYLARCVHSQVSSPVGSSFDRICSGLPRVSEAAAMLSAVKLERLGYVAKTIEQGDHDYEYFAYTATSDGLDVFLKHEDRIAELAKPAAGTRKSASGRSNPKSFDDMDDDIPF